MAERKRWRRRAAVLTAVLLLAGLAAAPQVRGRAVQCIQFAYSAVRASGATQSEEFILPELSVFALQLGVYDNGERAQREAKRLQENGVPCVIWQRERMRLLCSASQSEEGLRMDAAMGHETFVLRQTLPQVRLRLNAGRDEMETVKAFLRLPDTLFASLDCQDAALEALAAQTRASAQQAISAHPESEVYMQLAQSLLEWCDLLEAAKQTAVAGQIKSYAQVTMLTLCSQLREALAALSA